MDIYLDLLKAFNTLDHNILENLNNVEIQEHHYPCFEEAI